ncbi:MAG TPA: phosphotransferase [Solirubrobacteraceae bacterium]|nr:phosphotransferase [Solirubrobacteraceae bacterium]
MDAIDDGMAQLARTAVERYGIDAGTVELCNVSENHTYRVESPGSGSCFALRVHRPGYRSPEEIESELMWLDVLRAGGGVQTPPVVPAIDGARVVSVSTREVGTRNVVMFEWVAGIQPDLDAGETALAQFETLGAISARMHAHARSWRRPSAFTRPRWDYAHTLGPDGHWGPWQDGLGMGTEERRQLERLAATIATRLQAYGQDAQRFGLVHADLRLANVLIDDGDVRVIDFDDCGFSWYVYDFATAVSFMEDHPRVPELRAAWVRGYRSVAALEPAAEAELETLVMLRRLLLVAWIGSHHTFAPEAAELGAGFTAGTCSLAEDYLTTHSSP